MFVLSLIGAVLPSGLITSCIPMSEVVPIVVSNAVSVSSYGLVVPFCLLGTVVGSALCSAVEPDTSCQQRAALHPYDCALRTDVVSFSVLFHNSLTCLIICNPKYNVYTIVFKCSWIVRLRKPAAAFRVERHLIAYSRFSIGGRQKYTNNPKESSFLHVI